MNDDDDRPRSNRAPAQGVGPDAESAHAQRLVKALFIILTGLLILVNSFFVIAEYSLVRSRRAKLEDMAENGQRGARQALLAMDEIGDYIAACQVGITMASIAIGALGEPAIAHVFEPLLGGALGHSAAVAISVGIAYLIITIAQSIIGEIAPKLYTIQHAEDLARMVSRPLHWSRILFSPFIVVLNSASNALLPRHRHRSGRRARGRDSG